MSKILKSLDSQILKSKVVTPRQEIADRHQVQQYDREAERREVRRATPAPADATRGKQLERIHRPAEERDEDLGIAERHRLHPRIESGGGQGPRLGGNHDAGDHAHGQKNPSDHDGPLVHAVQYLQRGEPRVKEPEMLRFDLNNENDTIRHYRERVRQCEALGEFAMAEQIRQILVQEQDHQIDLATALGEEVPDLSKA